MDYLTVTEIAEKIGLSRQKTTERAKRENWQGRVRQGRGGGVEYEVARLPLYIQLAIRERLQQQVLMSVEYPALPVVRVNDGGAAVCLDGSTEKQRTQLGAREAVLKAIETLMAETKVGKEAAITTFLTSAAHPDMSHLANMLRLANDKRGGGANLPSKRTIQRWFACREQGSLLPKVPQVDLALPDWFPRFLQFYRTPQKPSVQAAFELFLKAELAERPLAKLPSVHQARRWLEKLGNVERERGRMGSRELKSILPFKRRGFEHLLPTEIYTADGHTFDAEVLHPDSGKPFRPEITTVVDVATRKIVGWSVDLAESGFAVLAAVCDAVKGHGIPAVFYVDNGGGYKNALMSDQATGLMGRLGITMVHSLPYSSQARGVIERVHQTVWVKAAKRLASYIGADMDAEASQQIHRESRQLMKRDIALKGVPALSNILSLSPNLLPDFDEFKRLAAAAIDEYNHQPHRSLPKVLDTSGCKRNMSPNELWALKVAEGATIQTVNEDESLYLFLPQVLRTVQRGQVALYNNVYFSSALQEFHGERLRVAFDIHNAERVWLFDDAGRYVCDALWNGNRIDYMPVSMVEQAKEKRVNQQIQRLEIKKSVIEAARPQKTLEHQECFDIGGRLLNRQNLQVQADIALSKMREPVMQTAVVDVSTEPKREGLFWRPPESGEERYALYCLWAEGGDVPKEAVKWCTRYAGTAEYRYFERQLRSA